MARRMSCAFTIEQVLNRTKTVTRRKGWGGAVGGPGTRLEPGDPLELVDKVMGLRRGQEVRHLATVEVVDVRREWLGAITDAEVTLEGFPGMTADEFVHRFFVVEQGIDPTEMVTRIEWRYLDGGAA